MADPKIKRVLMSVTDKTGIVEFARALSEEFGAEIISTGGTAKVIAEAGISVTPIDEVTQFPEMMDGRVKTLHPRVHGGLLAKRDNDSHMAQAADHGIEMIDMVVVNLYAFQKTVDSGADFGTCIENIDIGGPSMLRSAAKNFASVTVVTDPSDYDDILAEMREMGGSTSYDRRQKLAYRVFSLTAAYDGAISRWMCEQLSGGADDFAPAVELGLTKKQDLRYGENPHQAAAFYTLDDYPNADTTLAHAQQLQGKELSYNNYLDLDAAWAAVREFQDPACVIVKHLTPCGVCVDENVTEAYKRAHECDPISAYGGVMAFNREVTGELVAAIFDNKQFVEAIAAPSFDESALEMYSSKPNCRLMATGGVNVPGEAVEYRSVEGGLLAQVSDSVAEGVDVFEVAGEVQPTPEQMEELLFAWRAVKSVKSNAILIAKDKASVGAGGGQPNRVNSARIAVEQAGEKARGAVAASDAFFPFRDGFDVLADAGVVAVIEPGGSIRDEEVIQAANEKGVALVFTGHRHFRH
ncbi:MAG: bifunctional phosphoribosylaminoimidazolecarboxamide formyltransferase/IMP cyclohydrolase [Eggerthellaceae bacterium]|nr:bifunctional phosphoribosylaminoimidazolecarboxamide formyltransferase/IMP cyclohydrolase [Eggerthellaceae bacterium]